MSIGLTESFSTILLAKSIPDSFDETWRNNVFLFWQEVKNARIKKNNTQLLVFMHETFEKE
jgi:hypothetical protein